MTQVGKCDICRTRKVKCDEAKPCCGPCRKKNRPCAYTYGKSTAFVRENPNRFSNHVASYVLPILPSSSRSNSPRDDSDSSNDSPQELRLTSTKELGAGTGVFQTFKLKSQRSKKGKQVHSVKQEAGSTASLSTAPLRVALGSPLAARCAHMFGPRTWDKDSLALFGAWMEAIPSHIGSSAVFDSAVEYVVNSFATHRVPTFSTHRTALISRSRALKTLREAVERHQDEPTYDLVLAMKLHAYAELFVSAQTYTYITHSIVLSRLLSIGSTKGLDLKHYFSLVDNTYFDEVAEALLNGRPSFFDTSVYLTSTAVSERLYKVHPDYVGPKGVMHCFLQIPRLACLVRRSITQPEDTHALTFALSLATTIWSRLPSVYIEQLLGSQSTQVAKPPAPEIEDVIADTLNFNTLKQFLLCMRYWSVTIHISALIQNLWSHFPEACALAALPDSSKVENAEIQAAKFIVRSLSYGYLFSSSLPLVPLRVLGPLALSVGPWYRLAKRLSRELETLKEGTVKHAWLSKELEKADRMEDWVIEQCNRVHDAWNLARADKTRFETFIPLMAGEELPDWMPNQVSWEEARLQMRRQGVDMS